MTNLGEAGIGEEGEALEAQGLRPEEMRESLDVGRQGEVKRSTPERACFGGATSSCKVRYQDSPEIVGRP